jgi:hypothetical protein
LSPFAPDEALRFSRGGELRSSRSRFGFSRSPLRGLRSPAPVLLRALRSRSRGGDAEVTVAAELVRERRSRGGLSRRNAAACECDWGRSSSSYPSSGAAGGARAKGVWGRRGGGRAVGYVGEVGAV